jgi:hypothetical protein
VNRITFVLALLLLVVPGTAPGQDTPTPAPSPAPKKPPTNDIFSGAVTDLTAESVTVLRSALLQDSVKRAFIMDSQTVVEGKLRVKARVTVRYVADEKGQFHALHIIVR